MFSWSTADALSKEEIRPLLNPIDAVVRSEQPTSTQSYIPAAWRRNGYIMTLGFTSLLTTLPFSIYGFTFLLGVSPAQLSLALIKSLDWQILVAAIAFGLITTGVGVANRFDRIPKIINGIREMVATYLESWPAFLRNNIFLTFAIAAGVSMIAL